MNTVQRPKPTGLALWPLVGVVADRLKARKPLSAVDLGSDADVLVVQVGPAVPYRLLLLQSESDGMIRIELWQANGKMKSVAVRSATSDLVPDALEELVEQHRM